jgi:hypothetical protein
VRGFESADHVIAQLSVDPVPIALLHAPPAVLAALPGLTPAAVEFIVARRRAPRPVRDLHDLVSGAPDGLRPLLLASFAALSEHGTIEPPAWTIVARIRDQGTGRIVAVEQVVRRTHTRVYVTRELSW